MSIFEKAGTVIKNELTGSAPARALHDGDYAQALISTVKVGQTAANAATEVAANADVLAEKSPGLLEPVVQKLGYIKITPEFAENARSVLGKVGVGLVIAQGVYSTYKEKGAVHKAQRATAATLTAGTGYAASGILSGGLTLEGGAAATGFAGAAGTAVAWAAPVVLAGEIAYGTATIIKTERAYEPVDNSFKPDMARHSNIVAAEGRVAARLKELGVPKDPEGHWDLTRPENAARFEKAVREKRDEYAQVMQDNHTNMPRWIQFTNKQGETRNNYENAKQDLRMLDSALAELPDYQQKQSAHHEAKLLSTQQVATGFNANPTYTLSQITETTPGSKDIDIRMPATSLSVINQVANIKQRE